jgi:hypothetical protein
MSHGTLANNDAGGTDTTRSPSTEVADMVEENFRLPSKASRPNGVTENDHGACRTIGAVGMDILLHTVYCSPSYQKILY